MPEKNVRTTMRLPFDLWKRIRILALERQVHAQDLVVEALRLYLRKEVRHEKR